ncbi:MAG TPA: ATP-binding protein [Candidatus Krumholzibacteria bacterium]|nr:ATP-binding protein [Candidatus Krumholzibacteria bacterium]
MKGRKPIPRRRQLELAPKDLRWECDASRLGFETTASLDFKRNIIGQDRALDAIRLGLSIRSPGFNIFISGLTGTGKLTAIRWMLEDMDLRRDDLVDICYVHNFAAEDVPLCFMLASGQAVQFRGELKSLLYTLVDLVPSTIQSEGFKRRQSKIEDEIRHNRDRLLEKLEKEVNEKGFAVITVETEGSNRSEIAPRIGGEPVPMERLASLLAQEKITKADYEALRATQPVLSRKLEEYIFQSRDLLRSLDQRTADLERQYIEPLLDVEIKSIAEKFNSRDVDRYLKDLHEFILNHLPRFIIARSELRQRHRDFLPFEVNVVVDNGGRREAPVVIETSPSYVNVFGTIERFAGPDGDHSTDHTGIRGGSLLQANGGYLIMNMIDVLEEPMVWIALKRALKSQRHTIRGFDSFLLMPVAAIKPEPILLDIKLILIGDAWMYQALWDYDEDFRAVFKVKADFDIVMNNTLTNQKRYCRFIRVLSKLEKLPPFDPKACAVVIEHGTRLAGRRDRLSTRFSEIGDVAREAAHWAELANAKVVHADHVERALNERVRRVSLIEDHVQEMYDDGTIIVDTSGARIGQINGIAIYDVGDHMFARPSRITAETGVGRAGIVNIEREADMSGRVHNKGVLILEGYLRRMYAQDKPITISASICFEQGYSHVEGDSASSAEIFALLSSIAAVPLRQDVAVTGSIDQKGQIQPIGGVNEKIEGFYDVCASRGLTGKQGVMIPALNVHELMLRKDVVDAVKRKRFHIWAIRTVDEGLALLTGKKAGEWIPGKGFEPNSMHELVDHGLRHFHDRLHDSEDGHGEPLPMEKHKPVAMPPEKPPRKPPKPPRRRRRRGQKR